MNIRVVAVAVGIVAAVGLVPGVVTGAGASATPVFGVAGGFVAVQPARVADTAHLPPVSFNGTIPGHGSTWFAADDYADLPPLGAAGQVAVNMTAIGPRDAGYLTVYPQDLSRRPAAATLYFSAGTTTSGVALVGAGSGIVIYNGSTAPVRVLADIEGYTLPNSVNSDGGFVAQGTTVLNTATGVGAPAHRLGSRQSITLAFPNLVGMAAAVLLNLSAFSPAASGRLAVYPQGGSSSATSAIITAGLRSSNMSLVALPATGRITITNQSTGSVGLLGVLAGYIGTGAGSNPSTFTALTGAEVLDTARGLGAPLHALSAGHTLNLTVDGHAGVPATNVGMVALELVTKGVSGGGHLAVRGAGQRATDVYDLGYRSTRSISNLVLAPVSAGGVVQIGAIGSGSVQVRAYVEGYARSATMVTGRLLSPGGQPVAGMAVELRRGSNFALNSWSDPDGRYSFGVADGGPYTVCFSSSPTSTGYPPTGYASTCYNAQPINGTPTPVEVQPGVTSNVQTTLQVGGEITGLETTPTGGALPNGSGVSVSTGVGFYTSEAGGGSRYTLSGLPAGTYYLCFGAQTSNKDDSGLLGYAARCYNDQPISTPTPVTVTAGVVTTANAQLAPGGAVAGHITSQAGKSLSMYYVEASQNGRIVDLVTANGDGSYALGGLTAGTVHVCIDWHSLGIVDLPSCYSTDPSGAAADVTVTAGQVTRGIDFTVAEGGLITGRITGPAGSIAATVTATSSTETLHFTTNSTGDYALEHVPPGTYTVCAQASALQDGCYGPDPNNPTQLSISPGTDLRHIDIALTP